MEKEWDTFHQMEKIQVKGDEMHARNPW